MKIISGDQRGKNLVSPARLPLRPTSNKVREAFFNIFRIEIPGSNFLDLFAGTGAMGIGARSEGANTVFFVEKNPVCCKAINKNLIGTGVTPDRIFIFRETAEFFLTHRKIDLFRFIFLDPPYNYTDEQYLFLLQKIRKKMNSDTIVILEHEKKGEIEKIAEILQFNHKEKRYGRTKLSILQQ